jgi:hypothetical protein
VPETATETPFHAPRAVLEGAWAKTLHNLIAAGTQAIAVVGTEPAVAAHAIITKLATSGIPTISWDCVDGFRGCGPGGFAEHVAEQVKLLAADATVAARGDAALIEPLAALRALAKMELPALPAKREGIGPSAAFLLHNFYPFFADPAVAQQFENLCKTRRLSYQDTDPLTGKKLQYYRVIHFVQAPHAALDLKGITTVAHWITPHPLPLPDEAELLEDLIATARGAVAAERAVLAQDPAYLGAIAAALRGLDRHHASDALYLALRTEKGFAATVPAVVRRRAADLIAGATAVGVVGDDDRVLPEDLGGIANVRRAVERAARSYTEAGRAAGLDPRNGIFLTGVPGSGKSAFARACATLFERATGRAFTTLRVDVGGLFGGIVGQTEAAWRDAVAVITAFGPDTIVWFDEFEKAFGDGGRDGGDSGVARRLFGSFLEWMADPRRSCYVVAALNDPLGVPPEVFRAGRFDGGFFFDLPAPAARAEILRIHLAKRLRRTGDTLESAGLTPPRLAELAGRAADFLPSELEEAVKRARDDAFCSRDTSVPTAGDLAAAIDAMAPRILAKTQMAALEEIRRRCLAEPADDPPPPKAGPAGPGPGARGLDLDGAAA